MDKLQPNFSILNFMFSVSRVATPTQTEEQWALTKNYRNKIIQE